MAAGLTQLIIFMTMAQLLTSLLLDCFRHDQTYMQQVERDDRSSVGTQVTGGRRVSGKGEGQEVGENGGLEGEF